VRALDPWEPLRAAVRQQAPRLSAPPPAAARRNGTMRCCEVCLTPLRDGRRCFQCRLHAECLPGLLPDAVLPVAYADKGGYLARNLWLYKSARPGAAAARAEIQALLLMFLRDHWRCAWRRAADGGPTHVAVVPSGRARPGQHPLRSLLGDCISLPWAGLAIGQRDDPPAREADPARFRAARLTGARVLLLDDTWTTGSSAVSASAALKLAGAAAVAVVVVGRHVDRRAPAGLPFRPWSCALHGAASGH
jgi:hypothetical protein